MTRTQRLSQAQQRRRLIWRTGAPLTLSAALLAVGLAAALPAAATGNSLRIDPATSTVPQGGTFVAHVVQSASVATSGAGATVTFDPALLQITAVARGAGYAAAPVFNGASANAIAAANTTGSLAGVSAAFFPPDSVPAGDADAIDVTFRAVGCGTAQLGLPTGVNDAALLDGRDGTYGDALQVSTEGGSVTTCVAATPTPSPSSPPASGSPTPPPSPSPSPSPTPPAGNTIRLLPTATSVAQDATFSVRVVQHGESAVGGITATIAFDSTVLQITGITASSAYSTANARVPSLADGSIGTTIASANKSGRTQIAGGFLVDATTHVGDSVPAGDADFITIQFKAVACGTTPLLLPGDAADNQLIDGRATGYGKPLATGTVNGSVTVCAAQSTPTPSVPAGNSLRIAPFATLVIKNGGFTVRVVQKTTLATGGTTATVLFDPSMLQVVSVTKSDAFAGSAFFQGATPAAIKAANSSGRLNQVAAAFVAPGAVPAGEADFISIEFKSIACGESALLLPNDPALTTVVDGREGSYGQPVAISTVKGIVQACDKNAKPTPRPTRTPSPTTNPTPVLTVAATPAGTSDVTQPIAGDTSTPGPTESPDPGPAATALPAATVKPATAAAPTRLSRAQATMPPASSVAFVGLGVASVIAALVIVLVMTTALAGSVVIPLLVVRAFRGRASGPIGNQTANRE